MIEAQILDLIYELEQPLTQANDFNNLFVSVNELLQECKRNIIPSITEIELKAYLNNLWLNGKILRFLDKDFDEVTQNDPEKYKESEVLHRKLLIVN